MDNWSICRRPTYIWAIFATPFNEWNMWGYIAQVCYVVAISGIAINWHEQEESKVLNKASKL